MDNDFIKYLKEMADMNGYNEVKRKEIVSQVLAESIIEASKGKMSEKAHYSCLVISSNTDEEKQPISKVSEVRGEGFERLKICDFSLQENILKSLISGSAEKYYNAAKKIFKFNEDDFLKGVFVVMNKTLLAFSEKIEKDCFLLVIPDSAGFNDTYVCSGDFYKEYEILEQIDISEMLSI